LRGIEIEEFLRSIGMVERVSRRRAKSAQKEIDHRVIAESLNHEAICGRAVFGKAPRRRSRGPMTG